MDPYIITLIILSLPCYWLAYKTVFRDLSDLGESILYIFKPNLLSLLQGQGLDDAWASFKFHVFVLICAGMSWGLHNIAEERIVEFFQLSIP